MTMAYQKYNTVDYFPHAVSHGRKMFIIRNLYGNDGYAVWFMLLEQLGKAHNHYLNLNDATQLLYLTVEMKVTQEQFFQIINSLVELEEFDRELWLEAKVIYSEKFVESVAEVYKRRKNALIQYSEICMQFLKNGKHNSQKCKQDSKIVDTIPQSKVEYTKVKKTKEDLLAEMKERKSRFASTLKPFLETYGSNMLNDFYAYWTEDCKTGYKFRQELENSWSLDRRLKTWSKNERQVKGGKVETQTANNPDKRNKF